MRLFFFMLLGSLIWLGFKPAELERLSQKDQGLIRSALEKLAPVIEKRMQSNDQMLLTYDELFAPLNGKEKKLLNRIRSLKPAALGKNTPFLGFKDEGVKWVILKDQWVVQNGIKQRVSPAALPEPILEAYEKMMAAMEKDLGKRLYIESGYRSGAYQLYLFIFYLEKRNYSLLDTSKWNALPGYSEHGFAPKLALDLINREGINGDMNPEAFEKLDEYQWLLKHASKYGFTLSFSPDECGRNWIRALALAVCFIVSSVEAKKCFYPSKPPTSPLSKEFRSRNFSGLNRHHQLSFYNFFINLMSER